MQTSIAVDSEVKERLAVMAREKGMTIADYLREHVGIPRPTEEEQAAIYAAARAYVREHLCPSLSDEDLTAGEWFWQELRSGQVPASLEPPWQRDKAA